MLDFGMMDASSEARQSPKLLMEGYFDFQDASRRITTGDAWMIVGPKGAGKSAVFEHLRLMWHDDPLKFFNVWQINHTPIFDVLNAQTGIKSGRSSVIVAWKLLLLGPLLSSVLGDEGATIPNDVLELEKRLVDAGALSPRSVRKSSDKKTETTLRFNMKLLEVTKNFSAAGLTIYQAVSLIETALKSLSTSNRHVLALDNLDSLFGQTDEELGSLGALLDAMREINLRFQDLGLRLSVVLGIRHDMLQKVPSTDSAKLTEHAVRLDWSMGEDASGNNLWRMLSHKAKLSVTEVFDGLPLGDIRKAYLSEPIGIGRYANMSEYLLSNTRYLPRDLNALMQALKLVHPGAGKVRENAAREAVRNYAETYFTNELSNNLSGAVEGGSPLKVSVFFDALSCLPDRHFTLEDVRQELDGELDSDLVTSMMRQLYFAGGVGVQKGNGRTTFTTFDYRRVGGARFSAKRPLLLHNALVSAWNIPWT